MNIRYLRYLTHPQVTIDATIPVPDWELSYDGKRRIMHFAHASLLHKTKTVICSNETKAIQTAEPIATRIGATIEIHGDTHENDRSATGFLDPNRFEEVATAFFESPTASILGWERAIDAQRRIVGAYERIIRTNTENDILMVGHGGVGTLLYCHLAGLPINRVYDQKPGGGNLFSFDLTTNTIEYDWRPIEEFP